MAIWPFGRKNKNKNKSKKREDSDAQSMGAQRHKSSESIRKVSGSEINNTNQPVLGRRPSRQESQRRKHSSSRRLTKAQRSRNIDSEKAEPLPPGPLPAQPPLNGPDDEKAELSAPNQGNTTAGQQLSKHSSPRGNVPSYYFQDPTSMSSLQPETFNVIPALRSKRSANEPVLPRRKSSKRKATDHAREKEVRAMTSPIPVPKRPTSHASGLLARDSKKIPGGLNRSFQRPLSEISLPQQESVHSAMSLASDSHGFRVNVFDALSPRPTIHYFENPRNNSASGSIGHSRSSTRKEKQPIIPEEVSKSKKRIADLADDLNAGSLRELMERDRRRSERNRRSEQEKLQRRLQRKADKQRAGEKSPEAASYGPAKENIDPNELSEDDVGLEIARATTATAVNPPFEQRGAHGTRTPESWTDARSREFLPLESPLNHSSGPFKPNLESPTSGDEHDVPILKTAKAVRLSQASMSPPTSPTHQLPGQSSLSQLSEIGSRSTPDIPEQDAERRDSDASGRFAGNWTAIFRRSGTRARRDSAERGRAAPLEFSNTSRESFARQMPPSAFTRIPPARSGTPVRTQSRFREDLPELPTPPDSRLHSPEASVPTQLPRPNQVKISEPSMIGIVAAHTQPLSHIHPAFREEVALSRHQSMKSQTADIPSSAILSQSLASVDSEGSWLTGRPVKRSSQTLVNPLHESGSSLQQRLRELGASEEELRIAENENVYRSRDELSVRDRLRQRRYLSGETGIGNDSEDDTLHSQPPPLNQDEGKWHNAIGKHPTIVRPSARAKSREGLLNDFQAAEDSTESSPSGDSPIGRLSGDQIIGPENSYIHRATSIDLVRGHARHISAGSARLLNLPPRSSGEMKRLSTASGERSPLGEPLPAG